MHVQPLGQLLLQVYFALGFVLLDYFLLEISFTRFAHLSVTTHHNACAGTRNLITPLHDITLRPSKMVIQMPSKGICIANHSNSMVADAANSPAQPKIFHSWMLHLKVDIRHRLGCSQLHPISFVSFIRGLSSAFCPCVPGWYLKTLLLQTCLIVA